MTPPFLFFVCALLYTEKAMLQLIGLKRKLNTNTTHPTHSFPDLRRGSRSLALRLMATGQAPAPR